MTTATVPVNPLAEGLETVKRAPPGVLVVFGASGDLTHRKLLPALERLSRRRLLPAAFAVIGVARTDMSDDGFRDIMAQAVPNAGPGWGEIIKNSAYVAGEYSHPDTFGALQRRLKEIDEALGTGANRTYYLATIPEMFGDVARALGKVGLNEAEPGGASRLVIEKPFGRDQATARDLDNALHEVFEESQIYRIDHYLGKETVQNVLALRFANAIFEPLWSRNYIDHVQVTVAETVGVEKRGNFYETAGALRDIVQNHVMQVLSLTLMEPPSSIDAQGIRNEKVKALRSVVIPKPSDVVNIAVRAQYDSGWVEGNAVPGYRQEPGVSPQSQTETYVALKLAVDNWRWAGVPIYIRTGKRLPKRVTEVALQFKAVPHLAFPKEAALGLNPNALVMRIQPDEGVTLRFGAKVPGQAFMVRDVLMDFSYGATFLEEPPDAYERLLLDAMVGDPTLFIRSDEVDTAWGVVQPLLEAWAAGDAPLAGYASGSWGQASGHPHRTRRAKMADPVGTAVAGAAMGTASSAEDGRGPGPGAWAADDGPAAVHYWEKRGATLGEVIAALPELRRQASGREAGTRTAVMTLVMVTSDDDSEDYAASVRSLGAHHPCRVVVLRPEPDSTPAIDATACLWRAEPPEGAGHPVFFEEVHLRIGGQAASHLASIAGPFVLADLPVVMWFPGQVPDPADPLLRLASAVVVDTRAIGPAASDIGHSYRTLLELANRQPVVDLSWVRLQPWRELLAGLFATEHNRAFLPGVRLATVTGKPGPRHMLGGWLMAQLDLRARSFVLTDAKHVDIILEADLGDEHGRFQVKRDDRARAVWAEAELSRGLSHRQALPLPDDSLTSALAAAVSNLTVDRVWERALAAAATLAS